MKTAPEPIPVELPSKWLPNGSGAEADDVSLHGFENMPTSKLRCAKESSWLDWAGGVPGRRHSRRVEFLLWRYGL